MAPTSLGILLALLSSLTTASAHALLKSGRDKFAIRAMTNWTCAALMLPVCMLVPRPTLQMLPWLAAAGALHTVYQLVLIRSYETSDFALAYPISRGIAPASTALLGLALLGDHIAPVGLIGIAAVSAGILMMAGGRRITPAGLSWAVTAGLFTTAYTLVDAHAVRLAPQALTFVAWYFVLDGLLITPIFLIARQERTIALLRAEGRQGLYAGLANLVSFGAALMALSLSPVGVVSGLRETTIVAGMLIAVFALKEQVDLRRATGAAVITVGALLVVFAAL